MHEQRLVSAGYSLLTGSSAITVGWEAERVTSFRFRLGVGVAVVLRAASPGLRRAPLTAKCLELMIFRWQMLYQISRLLKPPK
ncbi:hypothetical protein AV530_009752 [Patagioenas fasciata monilis]|uniref:Uncharacterized protein n=1 Tax=Patagioenas fasciata monilis TaxID=372326 RepID=A0A1V4KA92_PATFA|nr:hypothetical protein AV530_009752 [Patagioenas fasciata monilis]